MLSPTFESRPIFLVGFMATGKSTVGLLLAARLQRRFIDLDAVIEQEAHATISELFVSEGEDAFRAREAELLRRIALDGPHVVAVGGGLPCHGDNLARMSAAGFVVALDATVDAILARIGDDLSRPLLAMVPDLRAEIVRLRALRAPFYARAHLTIETSTLKPSQVVTKIAEEIAG